MVTLGSSRGISYFISLIMAVVITIVLGTLIFASSTGLLGSWYVNRQLQVLGAYKLGGNLNVTIKNVGNVELKVTDVSVRDATKNLTIQVSPKTFILPLGSAQTVSGSGVDVSVGDLLEVALTLDDGSLRVFKIPVQ